MSKEIGVVLGKPNAALARVRQAVKIRERTVKANQSSSFKGLRIIYSAHGRVTNPLDERDVSAKNDGAKVWQKRKEIPG